MKLFIIGLLFTSTAFAGNCRTKSNGYNFDHSSRSEEFSRKKAIDACMAHSLTDNQECHVNAVCDSDPARYPVQCGTISNGYRFQIESMDSGFSENKVIKQCQAHSLTDNAECTVNIACNDRRNPEFVGCQTSSKGYEFQHSSRSEAFSAEKTVRKCQAHSLTDNEECEVNLECGL